MGFTLIELLIVIAIIAVLSMIGMVNFREAHNRALTVQCVGNLRAIGDALIRYQIDEGVFPPADGVAGPEESQDRTVYGDGPAANGFWSAPPNSLVHLGYLTRRDILFCPTLSRSHPDRRENLRYAYNASAVDSGGFGGGQGRIDGVGATGEKLWICRCLHLNHRGNRPDRYLPFPHGRPPEPGRNLWGEENVLWNNGVVSLEPGASP